MYKSLLIHHNNVPDLSIFDNNIIFSKSDENIDSYIHNETIEEIKSYDCDIIYIKDSLSSNYLEFYGLVLAYHIRLSIELKNVRFVPIVILSDIDGFTLNKIEPISKILFTKNIFLEPNRKETIEKYNNLNIQSLSQSEYQSNFLDLITVEPPENSTNHSIANKWAIYKWAKELKISNSDKINALVKELSSQLYFKYIKVIFAILDDGKIDSMPTKPIVESKRKIQRKKPTKKKVLYIDDEYNTGWDDIFKRYFPEKRGYEFESLAISYKGSSFDSIEKPILDAIGNDEDSTDLIILDMRLVDTDHKKETSPEDISGIKILNSIKNISVDTKLNPGIQVIMLTASGRSDILDEALKDNKIIGYIKKEHPEDITLNTQDNIKKLNKFIEMGEENFYLKKVWDIQYNILNLDIFKDKKYNQIKVEVGFIFNILNSGIENKFKFSMLTIYKILEIIRDLYIEDKSNKFLDTDTDTDTEIKAIYPKDDIYKEYFKDDFINGRNKEYHYLEHKDAQKYYYSTANKIHAIAYEKLSIKDKNIHEHIDNINQKRNKYIHPPKKNIEITVTSVNIIEWFKMLETILSKVA